MGRFTKNERRKINVFFLQVLFPIYALIALGYLFFQSRFLDESFWISAKKLTYYVLFPALLVQKLSQLELSGLPLFSLTLSTILPVLAVSLLLILIKTRLKISAPAFTSVFQGSIRLNTYLGLATASALLGEEGLVQAAIMIAFLTPLVNVLSVGTLVYYTSPTKGLSAISKAIFQNPVILACVTGISLSLLPWPLWPPLTKTLDFLGKAALPMGLLTVGAGLDFQSLSQQPKAIFLSSLIKLFLLPSLAAWACSLYYPGDNLLLLIILFTALPTSVSSYILAYQLGGDHKLMAGIVTIQTFLSMFSLPLIFFLIS